MGRLYGSVEVDIWACGGGACREEVDMVATIE